MKTLGMAAVAFLLAIPAAHAQDAACKLRCITIYQYFSDEISATIPLTCDTAAIYCKGEGALRINGEMVPTAISAEFTAIGVRLRFLTAQGELNGGSSIVFNNPLPTQSKTFSLRWPLPKAANGLTLRQTHALGGHIKLIVENYEPLPLGPAKRL